MKKEVLIRVSILVVFMSVASVSAANCTTDWHCTPWSECIGGSQIRSCVDFNLCGTTEGKPIESQSCYVCEPQWSCTDWDPEECPETGIQTKNCTDSRDCGTSKGRPVQSRLCDYKPAFSLGFVILVAIILFLIVVDVFLILRQWEKINPPIEKKDLKGKLDKKKSSGFSQKQTTSKY